MALDSIIKTTNDSILKVLSLLDNKINSLDSFNQSGTNQHEFTQIHEKLDIIESAAKSDNLIKLLTLFASITIPIIVGILIFKLNKNKEFTIKKSELVGAMFGAFFEFKWAIINCTYHGLQYNFYTQIAQMLQDDEISQTQPNNDYDLNRVLKLIDVHAKKYNEQEGIIKASRKEINTLMGQYRFYLSTKKKKKLLDLMESFTKMRPLVYDFSNEDIFTKVEALKEKYLKEYNQDIAKKYKASTTAIEEFMDKN